MTSNLTVLFSKLREKINELHVVSKDGQQRTEALILVDEIEKIVKVE